jgi:hypothetical protein
MRQRILFFFVSVLLVVCYSCDRTENKRNETGGKVLAEVYNYKLYESDLKSAMTEDMSKDDSARFAQTYINSWVREMLLVHQAEQNLGSDEKNVEEQLRKYRNSLIIYNYEQKLVQQQLDTIVSEAEIEKYYNEHPDDFTLKNNIIKVVYVKVDKKAPNVAKLKNWIRSTKPLDKTELEGYCLQFAVNYYLDDQSWLLFDDLLKEVPIPTYNKELFLQNNRYVEVSDTTHLYFVDIRGFMIRDSKSPITFEKENIRSIIINQRKRDLIDRMRNDIYNDAINKKEIKINAG